MKESDKEIEVIPQDDEDAKNLQASIALYNAQNNDDEMKSSILKQQMQSLQATQHSEVTTVKAFRSYKEP